VERVIQFLGGPRAVGAARTAVLDQASDLPADTLQDLELLVSEVVTNAVRHGGADHNHVLELRLLEDPGVVRVEVTDEGPGFDRGRPTTRPDGGWGLLFVDKLADRWDVEHEAGRTVVWFEMDISQGGPEGRKSSSTSRSRHHPPPMPMSA
jgi:anti-sigma regulatory factor (Ser/Thr protein kinase)